MIKRVLLSSFLSFTKKKKEEKKMPLDAAVVYELSVCIKPTLSERRTAKYNITPLPCNVNFRRINHYYTTSSPPIICPKKPSCPGACNKKKTYSLLTQPSKSSPRTMDMDGWSGQRRYLGSLTDISYKLLLSSRDRKRLAMAPREVHIP